MMPPMAVMEQDMGTPAPYRMLVVELYGNTT
jgi:hypothetical protein